MSITLRDELAIGVLSTSPENFCTVEGFDKQFYYDASWIAKRCYELADAMLTERRKTCKK